MWWLWFAGPIGIALVFVLTGINRDDRERRARAAAAWRVGPGGGARQVRKLAPELAGALEDAGGGVPLAMYELFPKLAYLAVMASDASVASDHQTVIAKLDGTNPTFKLRPLPLLDGKRLPNTGVAFTKDPEFMDEFLVEGDDARAIVKWLGRPLRNVLLELPGAWLSVEGKVMTLSLFGAADEDQLDELVVAADTLFAEHGAEGGPSLLGDEEEDGDEDDEAPAPKSTKVAKAPALKAKTPVPSAKAKTPLPSVNKQAAKPVASKAKSAVK